MRIVRLGFASAAVSSGAVVGALFGYLATTEAAAQLDRYVAWRRRNQQRVSGGDGS